MKQVNYIISLFLLLLSVASGCVKEYSYEGGPLHDIDSTGNVPVKSEWSFEEAGNHFYGPVDTAYLSPDDLGEVIFITGTSSISNEKFFIRIKDLREALRPGRVYQTQNEEVKFFYYNSSDTLYKALPYHGGNISVNISAIDATKITGTFYGGAENGSGKNFVITNGKFSSPLNKALPDMQTGSVMLWAKELCNGPFKIKVNDIPGEVSDFSNIVPDCDNTSKANYILSPGTYDWVAYCGNDSVNGKVTVKENKCAKILIDFPFKPPLVTGTSDQLDCVLSTLSFGGCLFTRCKNENQLPMPNSVTCYFSGQQVTSMLYTTFAGGFPLNIIKTVTESGNTIYIDKSLATESYFITDASGRVVEYHGLKDPAVIYPVEGTVVKYEYDNAGNMIDRIVHNPATMSEIKRVHFTWQNGNVIEMTETNVLTGYQTITGFEYYTNRVTRLFPFTFTNVFELLMFQPLINTGNPLRNPVKMQTIHAIDFDGKPVMVNYNYKRYFIDANNYVTGFTIADDYGTSTNFSFAYSCF